MKPTLSNAALGLALTFTLASATPALAQRAPLSETMVDVSADREPVRDVLRRLEGQHGLNYVVSEEVLAGAGSVTVRLKQVALEDALQAICAACGLSLEVRGRILVILPRETRRLLPPVRKDGGSSLVPKKGEAPSSAEAPRPAQPRRPLRAANSGKRELARAVGTVLEVDRKNRLLRVDVDGLKRDFYFMPPEGAGVAQTARLEGAMARLAKGHRVALEYCREGTRSLVVSLVGGDEVRDRRLAVARKPARAKGSGGVTSEDDKTAAPEQAPATPKNRSRIEGPSNPNTAPEGVNIPDGVLAGRFVSYSTDEVSVRRADGEVISVALPKDADRRAKVLAVVETLDEGVKVYFIYGEEDGKKVIKDTGITEVKSGK